MHKTLVKNWWVFVLRGLLGITFGVLAILWPALTLIGLVWAFAAYAIVDGLFQGFSATTRHEDFDRWWLILLESLFGIIFGVVAFLWPGITVMALSLLFISWALLTGMVEIAAAIELRKQIHNEWLLALSGVLSIIVAVFMIIWPSVSVIAAALMIGVYAIVFGMILIVLGLRLRASKVEFDWEPQD